MQNRFKFKVKFETDDKIEIFNVIDISFESQQVFFRRQDGMVYNIGLGVKGAELIQCTGKKDKNNNLIFEGDIVRFYFDNDEIIAVIEWDDDECRFYLNTTDFFKDKYVTDYEIVNQEEYEVIGNIYENPDLLK